MTKVKIWRSSLLIAGAFFLNDVYAAQCEFTVHNEWNSGFTASVSIRNDSNQAINGWTTTFEFPDGTRVTDHWSSTITGNNPYEARNVGYNSHIGPNSSVEFGFNGAKSGNNIPTPTFGGICAPANTAPTARASGTPLNGETPLLVNFNGASSFDPDGDAISYRWDFSNGNTSTSANPSQTFSAGTYNVTLVVNDGTEDSETVNLTVTATDPVDLAPTANIQASTLLGTVPFTVNFNGSASSDPEGNSLTYRWNFANGDNSNLVSDTTTFTSAGTYTVSLTVNDGGQDSQAATVTVVANDPVSTDLYSLDSSRSSLHFVSTKKLTASETHTFRALTGGISEEGVATLTIDLNSIESGIDIRNQRMRNFLFETATFPTAEVSLNVDTQALAAMSVGSSVEQSITASVDMHGVAVPVTTDVRITKASAGSLLVQNTKPILVQAADFNMTAGVDTLQSLASLTSISYAVPTSFTLIFNANAD